MSTTSVERQSLLDRLRRLRRVTLQAVRRDPALFRRTLALESTPLRLLRDVMQSWQERDWAALDPAWLDLVAHHPPGRTSSVGHPHRSGMAERPRLVDSAADGSVICRRAWIERPRGHSKTTDASFPLAWTLQFAPEAVEGLAAAADRDQAALMLRAVRRTAAMNRWLLSDLEFLEHVARNRRTGSRLTVISSDVRGSYGALVDFIVCDELCHWRDRELWESLLSAAAKKPRCLLLVLTNAGAGLGWQWEIREQARRSPAWYFSSLNGPQAPWITPEQLAEQQSLLPPSVFRRLWLNEWQHSDGEFVSLAEAEACQDAGLCRQTHGQPGRHYVAAVDYAEKHDLTVGCVCHREGMSILVDRMDVVVPTPVRPTPVAWVERWMHEIAAFFPGVLFVVDAYQLLAVLQEMEGRYAIRRFDFRAGAGHHQLALTLRQLILQRRIRWYPGCGQATPNGSAGTAGPQATETTPGTDPAEWSSMVGRDDLETELASLLVRESASGHLRIDHRRDGRHHDDRAFAVGAACLELLREPPACFEVTPPNTLGEFDW